jgi:Mlc titration factor MtfA (ptsG expression regulator)
MLAAVFTWLQRLFRPAASPAPQSSDWQRFARRWLLAWPQLSPEERARLDAQAREFLHRKRFEGCAGFEVTEEMRAAIAANACLLTLGRPGPPFPRLVTVLVYEKPFPVTVKHEVGEGVVEEYEEERTGEAWDHGSVILAWEEIEDDREARDGRNVVVHEFAHLLDLEAGGFDGAPGVGDKAAHEAWAKVFRREFDDLVRASEAGEETLLDDYGASDPAEFFAVATECFFGDPLALRDRHPKLYRQLQRYFNQDPAARRRRRKG